MYPSFFLFILFIGDVTATLASCKFAISCKKMYIKTLNSEHITLVNNNVNTSLSFSFSFASCDSVL